MEEEIGAIMYLRFVGSISHSKPYPKIPIAERGKAVRFLLRREAYHPRFFVDEEAHTIEGVAQ
jgi:hypothetical protein